MRKAFDSTVSAMFTNPLYNEYLFYASALSQIEVEFSKDLRYPASVYFCDKRLNYALIINPDLFGSYPRQIRLGILKHEVLHILWGHLKELKFRDTRIWQLATDCSVNQFIDIEHLPEGVILPKTLSVPENLSSYEYYDLLISNESSDLEDSNDSTESSDLGNSRDSNESGNSRDSNDSISFMESDHSMWDSSEIQTKVTKDIIENAQKFTLNSKGILPYNISEMIEIHQSRISIDKALRRFMKTKTARRSTSKRSSRRFPDRPEIRGSIKYPVTQIDVILDVSGSIDDTDIQESLGLILRLAKQQKISIPLIQVDSEAHEPIPLTSRTSSFERKGAGNTFLSTGLKYVRKDVIVITDGSLYDEDVQNFLDFSGKILWLIVGSGYVNPSILNPVYLDSRLSCCLL